jgi:hypothetical protein
MLLLYPWYILPSQLLNLFRVYLMHLLHTHRSFLPLHLLPSPWYMLSSISKVYLGYS